MADAQCSMLGVESALRQLDAQLVGKASLTAAADMLHLYAKTQVGTVAAK